MDIFRERRDFIQKDSFKKILLLFLKNSNTLFILRVQKASDGCTNVDNAI